MSETINMQLAAKSVWHSAKTNVHVINQKVNYYTNKDNILMIPTRTAKRVKK